MRDTLGLLWLYKNIVYKINDQNIFLRIKKLNDFIK